MIKYLLTRKFLTLKSTYILHIHPRTHTKSSHKVCQQGEGKNERCKKVHKTDVKFLIHIGSHWKCFTSRIDCECTSFLHERTPSREFHEWRLNFVFGILNWFLGNFFVFKSSVSETFEVYTLGLFPCFFSGLKSSEIFMQTSTNSAKVVNRWVCT